MLAGAIRHHAVGPEPSDARPPRPRVQQVSDPAPILAAQAVPFACRTGRSALVVGWGQVLPRLASNGSTVHIAHPPCLSRARGQVNSSLHPMKPGVA